MKLGTSKSKRGFSLIELLVTISIYIIISAIVVVNYREYSNNAIAANAPEDVVLALRQAQVYGAGGKGCAAASPFDCRFGVVFTTIAGSEKGLIIYADNNDNKTYDPVGGDVALETIVWKDPSVIKAVECSGYVGVGTCTSSILNITFKRPSPDALINDIADMSGVDKGGYQYGKIVIWNGITGTGSKYSTTTISQAGQISVE